MKKGRLFLAASLLWLPAVASAQVVEYYHLDAIGNVLAVTDQNGNVVEQHDYLPSGEEWNPQPGTQPKRFTGKERDAETGLDYFGARYYGSRIGRFTTVDPVYTWRDNLVDPQRWNRYAYGRNNPLRYVDPNGEAAAEVARWIQAQVNAGRDLLINAATNNLSPYDAAQATFATEATARVINGFVEPFRVGESTGAALGRGDSGLALAAAVSEDAGRAGGLILMAVGAVKSPAGQASTLKPGPFASESIPLSGPGRNFSAAERASIDSVGKCHTCGTTNPGTKSGHFVVDHQPPVALAPPGANFRGYPQCTSCSFPRQANEVRAALREKPQ